MTGKRFEAPRPDWNILKRLGQLADGFDVDWSPLHAPRNPSPVEAFSGPADLCPGKSEASPARPTSVRMAPIRDRILGCDYVIGGMRSDKVRQGQTNNSGFSGASVTKLRHAPGAVCLQDGPPGARSPGRVCKQRGWSMSAATRAAERARYEHLKEHGICPACAGEDATPGRVLGPACAAKRRARYRAFRTAKLALPDPPCRDCLVNPRRPGLTSCQPCADRFALYQRERALWRRVA